MAVLLPALLLVGRAAAQACPGSLTAMATISNYSYPGSATPPLNLLACEDLSTPNGSITFVPAPGQAAPRAEEHEAAAMAAAAAPGPEPPSLPRSKMLTRGVREAVGAVAAGEARPPPPPLPSTDTVRPRLLERLEERQPLGRHAVNEKRRKRASRASADASAADCGCASGE